MSVVDNANVDVIEDANEQLESVKNVEVTTKYVLLCTDPPRRVYYLQVDSLSMKQLWKSFHTEKLLK